MKYWFKDFHHREIGTEFLHVGCQTTREDLFATEEMKLGAEG